jgi:hypothetical protein
LRSYEAFQFEILNYDKAMQSELLENKWRNVDMVVALNVVQLVP